MHFEGKDLFASYNMTTLVLTHRLLDTHNHTQNAPLNHTHTHKHKAPIPNLIENDKRVGKLI